LTVDIHRLVDAASGLLDPHVYTDPDVFELEMERVFGRCWLFLAHDSQIPNEQDYLTTYMGRDPIIVVRQKDGSAKAFLNACRHRAMRVCKEDFGNSRIFRCQYHGWTYGADGRLIGMPFREQYDDVLDKERWGLIPVPKIDNYRGLIFGTFDEDAPPLTEYLGDIAWYLDASLDRMPNGVEFLGGTVKWRIGANWKFAAEQFASDMYHTYTTHKSPYSILSRDELDHDPLADTVDGRQYSSPWGHGFGWWLGDDDHPSDAALLPPVVLEYFESTRSVATERIGDERRRMESHGTVFPNLSWLYSAMPTIRVWHPKSPNEMEVWSNVFVDKDAPQEVKKALRRFTALTFGTSGLYEQDDGENWVAIQNNLMSPRVRSMGVNLQASLGRGRNESDCDGRTGPVIGEMAARGYFHRWYELMSSEASPLANNLEERNNVVAK